jgi:peroxiredoxin
MLGGFQKMKSHMESRAMRWLVNSCWLTLMLVGWSVEAGEFNADRDIGDTAPEWIDLPGCDDKSYSLKDFDRRDVIVLVFTCNSCPYAVDYEERINRLASKYEAADARVGVVAINVNKIEADLLPSMKQRSQERDFKFPYLFDETQQIAKAYGAGRTPEFFVIDRKRKIVYMGAMDDSTKEANVQKRYVEDAIEATLAGKPISITETPPVGCAIRFARERKKG